MSMELCLATPDVFKKVVASVNEICCDACDLMLGPKSGACIRALDSAQVALVDMQLRPQYFTEFECSEDIVHCVNVPTVGKVLASVNKGDTLEMSSENGSKAETINFIISKGGKLCSYDIKTMCVDIDALEVPDEPQFDAVVTIDSKLLEATIKDMAKWSDTCTISASAEGVQFAVEGNEADVRVIYRNKLGPLAQEEQEPEQQESEEQEQEEEEDTPPAKKKKKKSVAKKKATKKKKAVKKKKAAVVAEDEVEVVCDDAVEVDLSLTYLVRFVKATNLCPIVKLGLSESIPCSLKYDLGSDSWVTFYLASKMKDDDDDCQNYDQEDEQEEGGRGVGSRSDY